MGNVPSISPHSSDSPSEQDLTQLFDRLPFAVSLIDTDGRCIHATQRAIEIFGRIALQMDGSPHSEVDWQLVDGDGKALDPSQLPSGITRVTGEEFENVPVGFPGKDGNRVWLQVSTRRLTDEEGPPYAVVESFTDVTAERAALNEVDLVSQMLTRAFDHAPIGIALVATDGRWLRVNRALCDLLGYSEAELLTTTFQDITHPDDLEADLALVEDILSGRRSGYQIHKRYIRADGRAIWAQLSVAVVQDKDGNPLHFISQIQDVTERHKLEEKLRELADRDHLTGLLNRRRFEEELGRQLERCARHGESAALLLLDIDRFKQVNDSGGHAAGDALLQSVADACSRRVRGTDLVARVGGDEFAAILVDSDGKGAIQVAEALLESIREVSPSVVTASIGLTIMRPDDKPDAVLARADHALYAVKDSGRDGVQLDSSLTPHHA
jgi:diguanylate cyclase (GGDEF)-like protein/PAS domain S-box-containing protein